MPITTDGLIWYDHSIAFFDERDEFLIICLAWGDFLVLDMNKTDLIFGLPSQIKQKNFDVLRKLVIELLHSHDAHERQTGAIHAGHMKIQEALSRLYELLSDKATFMQGGNKTVKKKFVFFVRQAAKQALLEMGKEPGNVITYYYPDTVLVQGESVGEEASDGEDGEDVEKMSGTEHEREK